MAGVATTDGVPSKRPMDADAAFSAIFERHHALIYHYLRTLVADDAVAEDLTRDSFVRAWRSFECEEPRNPKTWLYAIATNAALSAMRRRRLLRWLPVRAEHDARGMPSTADLEPLVGERAVLVRALNRLPAAEAACLLLRFQHGLSDAELAEALGVPVPTAKRRLCRARVAIREAYIRLREDAFG